MSITILFNSVVNGDPFYYHKEINRIEPATNAYLPLLEPNIVKEVPDIASDLTFISDEIKVFIPLIPGFYHFFYDSIGAFVKQYNKTPEALFIFDTYRLEKSDLEPFEFLKSVLIKKNIQFMVIDSSDYGPIYANNFYSMKGIIGDTNDSANSVLDFFIDEIDQKDISPYRKVYLSRSSVEPKDYIDIITDGTSHSNDIRIYRELLLESFFQDNGFDVVNPETHFKSFRDQLNYFYEVKVLVSATSGGITNAMFMQPNGKVVELITSKVNPLGIYAKTIDDKMQVEEVLHHYYVSLCWNKEHTYIGVSNKDRLASTLINKLKAVLV